MTESPVVYENDGILPHVKTILVQGHKVVVDPLKFSTGCEIKIREAYQTEEKVLQDDGDDGWEKGLKSRKLILAVGQDVIPRVCPSWTAEMVADELSHQSIGALLSFFLSPDWREMEPPQVLPAEDMTMIPTDPKLPKPKASPRS